MPLLRFNGTTAQALSVLPMPGVLGVTAWPLAGRPQAECLKCHVACILTSLLSHLRLAALPWLLYRVASVLSCEDPSS